MKCVLKSSERQVRAWILMPVRVKMALFSFIFSCFSTFRAVFFEMSYFIFTFSFLGKQLIISLLEKKLSGLPSQFQLSQLFLRGLCFFIFSIFIILYIYYNYIYIKQLYNNKVKKKRTKTEVEPLLKITETTETETTFQPPCPFSLRGQFISSATIPRAFVGCG